MTWNHNTTPPSRLPDRGTVEVSGRLIAYSNRTPASILAGLGIYRQGIDDLIPAGHQIVSQERVIRNGKSLIARLTEPSAAEDPQPEPHPNGLETASIVWPTDPDGGNDWESHVVDGVLVTDQVSASPRKSQAARDAIKAARNVRVTQIRTGLPGTISRVKDNDARAAMEAIAEILNLI